MVIWVYMTLVKTTITLPEELIKRAKIASVEERITLSEFIRDGMEWRLRGTHRLKKKKIKDPMKLLGRLSLGVEKIYDKRSDLYEDHIKRKMGY